MKYSQTHLTIILFPPPHCCPCQKSNNSTTNWAWETLGWAGKSLLTQILSRLPVKRGVLVSLSFPRGPCTWLLLWGLWVPWNVSFRTGPAKAFSWLSPFCQNYISKPWEQFWREIKALLTQLSLGYFLYASHSLVSANNIFPKCTGLRWYNSVIISMRGCQGLFYWTRSKREPRSKCRITATISPMESWRHQVFPTLDHKALAFLFSR